MDAFLNKLMHVLEQKHLCFDRGAFVMHVSGYEDLVQKLLQQGSPRKIAKTHDVFMKHAEWHKHAHCPICRLVPLTKQYEVPLRHFRGGCQITRKRVALGYLFRIDLRVYLYLKLETSPAMSATHAYEAMQRYVLKKAVRTDTYPRRENSYKNKMKIPNAIIQRDRVALHEYEESKTYDSRYRVGSELYIPRKVFAQLI